MKMPGAMPSNVVFLFGAGASAPFGIPTMKQFVVDFEEYLRENATKDEQIVYSDIKETLEKRLSKQVDLEGVFTVIDGIINYSSERLGLLSLYSASDFKKNFPSNSDRTTCILLKEKFQTFVRRKCITHELSRLKVRQVYQDLFNRFALEDVTDYNQRDGFAWLDSWTMFTTNYDTCLEYYWRQVARVRIDTGFEPDNVRAVRVLRSRRFLEYDGLQLLKLHGSINWKLEKGTGEVTEEDILGGSSLMGRQFVGDVMLYPVAEKELYVNPYISMLMRLNRELESKSTWVVIGYSFNDPVLQEIFVRNSNETKHLILVHPQASEIGQHQLSSINGKLSLMDKWFGLSESEADLQKKPRGEYYKKVNHQIIHQLVEDPRLNWDSNVVPT